LKTWKYLLRSKLLMSKQFINRKAELRFPEFRSNNAEFIIIYGGRRIGKTSLIIELIQKYGGIYLLARETGGFEI